MGSSMVRIWQRRLALMSLRILAKEVDLPDPVTPDEEPSPVRNLRRREIAGGEV